LSVLVLLVACKTSYPREQQSGKEDVAFLLFVSYKQYVNKPLTVVLDGGVTFTAKAVKDRKATYKGESYAVKPGARDIIVRTQKSCSYLHKRPNKLNYHNEKTFIYCPTCWLNDGLFDPKTALFVV